MASFVISKLSEESFLIGIDLGPKLAPGDSFDPSKVAAKATLNGQDVSGSFFSGSASMDGTVALVRLAKGVKPEGYLVRLLCDTLTGETLGEKIEVLVR